MANRASLDKSIVSKLRASVLALMVTPYSTEKMIPINIHIIAMSEFVEDAPIVIA